MSSLDAQDLEIFKDSVRSWVDREWPKAEVRKLESREFEYPTELWDQMAEAGFHGIGIPEEYGGAGGDATTQIILARELARSLAGLTWIWGLSSFAGGKAVSSCGSEAQRRKLLPGLASGELRFSIAVTEPSGGTDLLGMMRTRAQRCEGGWRVYGRKTWSSGANVADYILLLARTDPEQSGARGTTLFLLPNAGEGIETGFLPKLGMKCLPSCEVGLDGAFVPDDLVLGEPGNGWYELVGILNNERIMLAAVCCGILDGILEDACQYALERKAFGGVIGRFQRLQHYIADIRMWQRQAWLVTQEAAALQAAGAPCVEEALMAKTIASEYAVAAADLGIQILGGMGYSLETDMQRYWRDARLYRIVPISNEMARNLIAKGLGLPQSF